MFVRPTEALRDGDSHEIAIAPPDRHLYRVVVVVVVVLSSVSIIIITMTITFCASARALGSLQAAARTQNPSSRIHHRVRCQRDDTTSTPATNSSATAATSTRRAALLALGASVLAASSDVAAPRPSLADAAPGFETFYGSASPPTSYGGYGGNAEEDAKYTFEYPSGWKPAVPNKVEKGTQGIDCRVSNPRNKNQTITVVTFGRAGEDNKSFKLTDIETTVQGFAGADYDLQDAIAMETGRTNGTREFNNEPYYDIQIDSPDVTYLITVTVNYGKVFALFVKSPTKLFQQDEEKLRRIQDTFRTL